MSVIVLLACAGVGVQGAQSFSAPACQNDQLKVSVSEAGAGMSHWAKAIDFLNKSAESCQLFGVPGVDLLTASGNRFPIPECPNCKAYLVSAYQVHTVVLKPGEKAHALISSVTAYDKPLCSATEYVRITLAVGQPNILLKNSAYSCVSLNVSPYLPGSIENADQRANTLPTAMPSTWGKPVGDVQLSLIPFAPQQKVGYLGFHVFLRGMNSPKALAVTHCDKAILRIWRGKQVVRQISSASPLACVVAPLPRGPNPPMTGGDITTAFFQTTIDQFGTYHFDLMEQFRGTRPVTLISNRVAVQVVAGDK